MTSFAIWGMGLIVPCYSVQDCSLSLKNTIISCFTLNKILNLINFSAAKIITWINVLCHHHHHWWYDYGNEDRSFDNSHHRRKKYLPINFKGLFSYNSNGYRISYANFNLLRNCAIIKINIRSSLNYCKTSDLYWVVTVTFFKEAPTSYFVFTSIKR